MNRIQPLYMNEHFNIDLADKIKLETILSSIIDNLERSKSKEYIVHRLTEAGLDIVKAEELYTLIAESSQKGEILIFQLRNEILLGRILKGKNKVFLSKMPAQIKDDAQARSYAENKKGQFGLYGKWRT